MKDLNISVLSFSLSLAAVVILTITFCALYFYPEADCVCW